MNYRRFIGAPFSKLPPFSIILDPPLIHTKVLPSMLNYASILLCNFKESFSLILAIFHGAEMIISDAWSNQISKEANRSQKQHLHILHSILYVNHFPIYSKQNLHFKLFTLGYKSVRKNSLDADQLSLNILYFSVFSEMTEFHFRVVFHKPPPPSPLNFQNQRPKRVFAKCMEEPCNNKRNITYLITPQLHSKNRCYNESKKAKDLHLSDINSIWRKQSIYALVWKKRKIKKKVWKTQDLLNCSFSDLILTSLAFQFIYFILFYFILFYFILFYFILFYFILFYFILFYFILFYFISLHFI